MYLEMRVFFGISTLLQALCLWCFMVVVDGEGEGSDENNRRLAILRPLKIF